MRPPPVSKNNYHEVLHGSLTVRYKPDKSNKETASLTRATVFSQSNILPRKVPAPRNREA